MKNRTSLIVSVIAILLSIFLIVGWVKCIVKTTQCNWQPIGKAEVFYTIGSFTPLGGIIGWVNIEDK